MEGCSESFGNSSDVVQGSFRVRGGRRNGGELQVELSESSGMGGRGVWRVDGDILVSLLLQKIAVGVGLL